MQEEYNAIQSAAQYAVVSIGERCVHRIQMLLCATTNVPTESLAVRRSNLNPEEIDHSGLRQRHLDFIRTKEGASYVEALRQGNQFVSALFTAVC